MKLVMCFTQTTCPCGGASWSCTARSPLRWASKYHKLANSSQWARKEAQKASRTHLQRRPTNSPHRSCRASSQALPEAQRLEPEGHTGGRRAQCPSLVTRRWWDGEDKRGEQEALPPRTLLLDLVVILAGGSLAVSVNVRISLKQNNKRHPGMFSRTVGRFEEQIISQFQYQFVFPVYR